MKNQVLRQLKKEYKIAKIGYDDSISALPYMPVISKPYTQLTADKYYNQMQILKQQIDQYNKNTNMKGK